MTVVDELHLSFKEIIQLIPEAEISLRNVASEHFRKNLLLTAASHFEKQIVTSIAVLVDQWGTQTTVLNEFVRTKAIERQYHTYFNWELKNANSFFALFGTDFKLYMAGRCKQDQTLANSIKAFIELGSERNRLAHQDFGNYTLEKTFEEIYELYKAASDFVGCLEAFFDDFSKTEITDTADE